jgi:hypothetical protein
MIAPYQSEASTSPRSSIDLTAKEQQLTDIQCAVKHDKHYAEGSKLSAED